MSKANFTLLFLWPGWSGQGDDHSLQKASNEREWVLPRQDKIEEWKQDEAMDKQPTQNCDSVPAQLPAQDGRVLHVQDLPSHQENDPKWEIPAKKR